MNYREWMEQVLEEAASLTREVGDPSRPNVATLEVLRRLGLITGDEERPFENDPYRALQEVKAELAMFGLDNGESEHYFGLSREARLEGADLLRRVAGEVQRTRLTEVEEDFLRTLCGLADQVHDGYSLSAYVNVSEVFAGLGWDDDRRRGQTLATDLEHLAFLQFRAFAGGELQYRPGYYGYARAEVTSMDRPTGIFMSYSHEDKIAARWLGAELKLLGYRVWTDEGDIRVGESLLEKIAEAISEMDFLIALITETSVASAWCKNELQQAMTEQLDQRRVKVLPVRYGKEVETPGYLKPAKRVDLQIDKLDWVIEELRRDIESYSAERREGRAI
jgi:hypothetical protein